MIKEKIKTLLSQLNHGLIEREDSVKAALLTTLAEENIVLIGPPGTGKSLIARRVTESFLYGEIKSSDIYFEYLLTKFSTPEEIFGPLSITELKADRFKRNTKGYLPTAKIAFLDEIFKASSSILNALLTILNERIYHNGAEPQKVPLQALIAASNELPTDQDELAALYDRFLVRIFVNYVSQENLARFFEKPGPMPELGKLTSADLESIKLNAESVTLSPEIAKAIQDIWVQHKEIFKEDSRETLSDRRLKKVIKLLCVSAATNDRSQVDLSDVLLLKDCLWNNQENAAKVRNLILSVLRAHRNSVPKNTDTTIQAPSPDLAQATPNATIKGFKGHGTSTSPLIIETVEELADLSRPEVGMQGYYFKQTADIDCSKISHWPSIPFQGHYDGNGKSISLGTNQNSSAHTLTAFSSIHQNDATSPALFTIIHENSSITNLKLEQLSLALTVENSEITHCVSTSHLIEKKANNSRFSNCTSGKSLIANIAENCSIKLCQSRNSLITYKAINCKISDCLVSLHLIQKSNQQFIGGITPELKESEVERCFVDGKIRIVDNNSLSRSFAGIRLFAGISVYCKRGIIRACAIGKIDTDSGSQLRNRITFDLKESTLENNASTDENPGNDKIDGLDGKTVSAALFNQRYFENTLGWDFEKTWEWNNKTNKPELRSAGVIQRIPQQTKENPKTSNSADMLTQQLQANIWL